MKILKVITRKQRVTLHWVVNSPTPTNPVEQATAGQERDQLFIKITATGKDKGNSVYNFDEGPESADIILKNSEHRELINCFDKAVWPSVWHRIEGTKVLEIVKEAADYKSKEG